MSEPTQKDAELMIRLHTLAFSPEMKESWNYVFGLKKQSYEDFSKENPMGSDGANHFFSIGTFFNTVGILVKYGTIHEDLVFSKWGTSSWDKLGPMVKEARKAMKAPRFWENWEYLANRQAEWIKEHPPMFEE